MRHHLTTVTRMVAFGVLTAVLWALGAVAAVAGPAPVVASVRCALAAPTPAPAGGARAGAGQRVCAGPEAQGAVSATPATGREWTPSALPAGSGPALDAPGAWVRVGGSSEAGRCVSTATGPRAGRAPPHGGSC